MGFVVSMPPLGPVFFAVLSKGLHNENHDGLAIAMGSALVDTIYCLLALGGISLLAKLLPNTFLQSYKENEIQFSHLVMYIGGIFVVLYGVNILRKKETVQAETREKIIHSSEERTIRFIEHTKHAGKFSLLSVLSSLDKNGRKQIVTGIMLTLTSITLPASWIAIVGLLRSNHFIEHNYISNLLFCIGVFTGTYLWFFTLLKTIAINKHHIEQKTINRMHIFAGITLIVIGLTLLFKAYQLA